MSTLDINRSKLFYVVFTTAAFKAQFNSLEVPVKSVLELVVIAVVPAEKEMMERIEVKDSGRMSALNES